MYVWYVPTWLLQLHLSKSAAVLWCARAREVEEMERERERERTEVSCSLECAVGQSPGASLSDDIPPKVGRIPGYINPIHTRGDAPHRPISVCGSRRRKSMEKRLRRQCLAPEVVVRIESDLISQHPTSSTCLNPLVAQGHCS